MGRGVGRQILDVVLNPRGLGGPLSSPKLRNIEWGVGNGEIEQIGLVRGFARRWNRGYTSHRRTEEERALQAEIRAFKRGVPIERASTPPSSWYTNPEILNLELEKVFERRWQAVGRADQLQSSGDFFTGKLGRVRFVVCMDEQGNLRAFHNVCRHHAAAVATGSGCISSFVCPYHGWTYGLDGKLQKASRLGGIKDFAARENGLLPLNVGKWGPFVLIKVPCQTPAEEMLGSVAKSYTTEKEWLGSAAKSLTDAKIDSSLQYVATRYDTINCNWKVYCDNFLDGGYHVPHAHIDLSSSLNLKTYNTTLSEKVSIQSCQGAKSISKDVTDRVGKTATYAFVYPNFMINRYGQWMDTNLVLPITASQCGVRSDFFVERAHVQDAAFIQKGLEKSYAVQEEDITLCEGVQEGLQSPVYNFGRYAPSVEHAMHHFHTLLHEDLSGDSDNLSGLELDDLQHVLYRHPFT